MHPDGSLILDSLITQLKLRGYYLNGAAIAYYSKNYELYVSCATDPVPRSCTIPIEEYNDQFKFTIRAKLAKLPPEAMAANLASDPQNNEHKESKRPKERKISFIINKVLEWRKLYVGTTDDNGQIIKYSLEEAAEKVGVSKKSLDDYLLQLRLGKKYGFDFQENCDKKVGILRAFVKQKREEERSGEDNKNKCGDLNDTDSIGGSQQLALIKSKSKQSNSGKKHRKAKW